MQWVDISKNKIYFGNIFFCTENYSFFVLLSLLIAMVLEMLNSKNIITKKELSSYLFFSYILVVCIKVNVVIFISFKNVI
ncbi:hypothetical protein CB17B3395 [Clostridium botulinum B str. Eklund 17B (NRP)]|nr:hypothetical protein CB17B3395 [Clostridium botulinum B str. Eklund 17B (NRP)]